MNATKTGILSIGWRRTARTLGPASAPGNPSRLAGEVRIGRTASPSTVARKSGLGTAAVVCALCAPVFAEPVRWESRSSVLVDARPALLASAGPDTLPPLLMMADLDGDGDTDALTIGATSDREWINQGTRRNPVWAPGRANLLSPTARSNLAHAALVDADDDGDADLVLQSTAPAARMRWLENTGGLARADFRPLASDWDAAAGLAPTVSSRRFTFADVDQDGRADLISAALEQHATAPGGVDFVLRAHRNRGARLAWTELAPPVRWSAAGWFARDTALSAATLVAGDDFDRDGRADLGVALRLALHGGGEVSGFFWARNHGTGAEPAWSAPALAPTPAEAPDAPRGLPFFDSPSAVLADLDGDGRADWVTDRHWHPHGDNGRWGPGLTSLRFRGGRYTEPILTRWGSRDGAGLLLVDDAEQNGLRIARLFRNTGTAAAVSWATAPTPGPASHPAETRLLTLDLDGDGDDDLLTLAPGTAQGFLNTGSNAEPVLGNPLPATRWGLSPQALGHEADAGDLDADGDPDLVGLDAFGMVRVLENRGTNTAWFTGATLPPPSQPEDFAGRFMNSPGLADADGDGDLDFLIIASLPEPARLWTATNTGTVTRAAWGPLHELFSFTGFPSPQRADYADLDGDGDADCLATGPDGGVSLHINRQLELAVSPAQRQVRPGRTQDITAGGQPPHLVRWLRHETGGAVEPGALPGHFTYLAGTTAGLDVLEITDAGGARARVHLLVPDATAAAPTGRAILVGGAKSEADPVWLATDRMVGRSQETLALQGFAPENIRHLSFVPGRDLNGDGVSDDIHGAATLANLEEAFTGFAVEADRLLVHLVDHGTGVAGDAFVRLNPTEQLSAIRLRELLDGYQHTTGGDVTVVLDFCQAGAFLPLLANPAHTNRVVIASCGAAEPAYFIANGLVSFSSLFFNSLLSGADTGSAFQVARGAMSAYQGAVMDGLPNDATNRYATARLGEGSSSAPGRDVPRVGEICPNQTVDRDQPARIWAADVGGPHAITRVWAVVVPPDASAVNAADPQLDLPEFELTLNPLTGRHEAEIRGLRQAGPHQVTVFARDVWGSVSFPRQSMLLASGFTEKAVLVHTGPAGGKAAAIQAEAFRTLGSRRLEPAQIQVLGAGPRELDDVPGDDVDGPATAAALAHAITVWAADADKLTVILAGEAATNGWFQLDVPLDPSALDGWLDLHQGVDTARTQVVILDGDGTGAAVPALTPPTGARRIVLASAAPGRRAVLEPGASFTSFLLPEIAMGRTVGEAARTARLAIRRYSGNLRQKLLADDNGNGIANEKDKDLSFAATARIGAAFLTGDDLPQVGAVSPAVTDHPAGQPFLLLADEVTDADGIAEVWCEVTSPTNTLGRITTRIPLSPVSPLRWEAALPAPTRAGNYTLTFHARDTKGFLSPPAQSEFTVIAANQPPRVLATQPDAHEPDDRSDEAGKGDLPLSQFHTLHHEDDLDWILFVVPASIVVDIETIHLSAGLDTRLEIFRMRPEAEPELLESVDENGPEAGELAGLTFATPGLYLARVSTGAKRGEFTPGEYQINIHVPAGLPGGVLVMLYDQYGGFFINGTATLANLNTGTTTSAGTGGLYTNFKTPAGYYRIQAAPDLQGYEPGYDPARSSGVPGNPHSLYGNPREFGVDQFMRIQPSWSDEPNGGDGTVISFPFRAFASITGQALGLNGQGVTGASVRLTSQPNGAVYDRHPWASYGDPWITGAAGQFPDRLRLPPGSPFAVKVEIRGYAPWQTSIAALARGQVLNLGAITLTALDANANGIPDPWEFNHFSALVSATADPDGDGCSNLGEYHAGTDPNSRSSVLRVATDAAPPVTGGFQLRWMAVPDRRYRILAAENLGSEWSVVDLTPAGRSGLQVWTEPAPAAAARYYRIEPVAP